MIINMIMDPYIGARREVTRDHKSRVTTDGSSLYRYLIMLMIMLAT